MDIALVPGHTPDSPGACGGGLCEWPYVTTLAHMISKRVPQSCVIQRPRPDELSELVDKLNRRKPSVVVSLHLNAFDGSASGCETLYDHGGERLARALHAPVTRAMDNPDRGVKQRTDLAILSKTVMPAALLEPAFIDNETDREMVLRKTGALADAIKTGLGKYSEGT